MDGCQPGQSRGFKKEKTKMTFKFSGQYFRKSMETLFYYLVKQRKYVTTLQLYLELSNRNRPELIPVSCLQCTSKILDYRGLENLC